MASFRYYDNSDVIATLIITNFHLCLIQLWWQFFQILVYGDVVYNYAQTWEVMTLKKTVSSHLWRHVTMVAKFSDRNNREFKQRCWRRQKNWKKAIRFYNRAFLYVSWPSLYDYDVKLPNFMHPLYEVGEQNAKFSFSFPKLRYSPFGFDTRKFRQHLKN